MTRVEWDEMALPYGRPSHDCPYCGGSGMVEFKDNDNDFCCCELGIRLDEMEWRAMSEDAKQQHNPKHDPDFRVGECPCCGDWDKEIQIEDNDGGLCLDCLMLDVEY